jgi:hypothetical protein
MKKFDKITLRQHSDNANFRIKYPEKKRILHTKGREVYESRLYKSFHRRTKYHQTRIYDGIIGSGKDIYRKNIRQK